jgi:hypothetical protein
MTRYPDTAELWKGDRPLVQNPDQHFLEWRFPGSVAPQGVSDLDSQALTASDGA